MNILSTQTFVAGIFAKWSDAQHYLTLKPETIEGITHRNLDLVYPFFLLEIDNGEFLGYQTEAEARAQGGIVLYIIRSDFRPEPAWTDAMGSLDHTHLDEEFC